MVECRICNREVAGSNLGRSYFAPRSTQPSIPPGSVNEYQLRLGRQRQVWLIPIADERVGVTYQVTYQVRPHLIHELEPDEAIGPSGRLVHEEAHLVATKFVQGVQVKLKSLENTCHT